MTRRGAFPALVLAIAGSWVAACGSSKDQLKPADQAGGSGGQGTGGSATDAGGSAGSVSGGDAGAAGSGGSVGNGGTAAGGDAASGSGGQDACMGGNGCYACTPQTNVQFLNACSELGCPARFDNATITTLVNGQLPPLP
jgi:hypothetical protein